MMNSPSSAAGPLHNQLLASLPPHIQDRLLPLLEPCELPLGKVVYESRAEIAYVYFPTDSVVSLLYVTAEGNSAEISLVGNEGVVGIGRFLGANSSLPRAVVQSAGSAFRLSTRAIMDEFELHTELMLHVLRYVHTLMIQISQTAVCYRHHSLEQQLCRWLLLSLDRIPSRKLIMTQELIANMLGVRREGVTIAAGRLQKAGVIAYSRGHIRILDRARLEELSCECYGVVRTETDRLMAQDVGPLARKAGRLAAPTQPI